MIQSFRSPIRAFALALLTATLVMGRAYAADAPGEDPAALAARYAKLSKRATARVSFFILFSLLWFAIRLPVSGCPSRSGCF